MIRFLKGRIKSLGHALDGLRLLPSAGPNMWINFMAVSAVTAVGFALSITATEWAMLVVCFIVVIAVETINTALERLADHLHPEQHPEIGKAKDLMAAASLVAAMGAAIVGFLILGKYLLALYA